jgi:HemK-related putative methylase
VRRVNSAGSDLNLQLPASGLVPKLLGRLLHRYYRLIGRTRTDRAVLEKVDGMTLLVLPGVFNPLRMRTGAFFAGLLNEPLTRDLEVLDLGTGSGICALSAARFARHVVAVDINATAARCACINASIQHLDARIEVLHGDLFEPVTARRFDLILFNPPFLRGQPANDYDRAWRSTDIADRFAAGLNQHLNPHGCALLLLSSFGSATEFLDPLIQRGHEILPVVTRRYFNETVTVFRVTASTVNSPR